MRSSGAGSVGRPPVQVCHGAEPTRAFAVLVVLKLLRHGRYKQNDNTWSGQCYWWFLEVQSSLPAGL